MLSLLILFFGESGLIWAPAAKKVSCYRITSPPGEYSREAYRGVTFQVHLFKQ